MTDIQNNWMATHNGSGYWSIVHLTDNTSELVLNVTPAGYEGDLGLGDGLPTLTPADVKDLIHVLTHAVTGIQMGGWEEGQPIEHLISQAEAILREHRPEALGS